MSYIFNCLKLHTYVDYPNKVNSNIRLFEYEYTPAKGRIRLGCLRNGTDTNTGFCSRIFDIPNTGPRIRISIRRNEFLLRLINSLEWCDVPNRWLTLSIEFWHRSTWSDRRGTTVVHMKGNIWQSCCMSAGIGCSQIVD